MAELDRAVCDGHPLGFLEIIVGRTGLIIGATCVTSRAGEIISELALAMTHDLTIQDVANTIHPYPTYSTVIMQLAAEFATSSFFESTKGRIAKCLSKI